MRFVIPLILFLPACAENYGVDLFTFGASHHSNRDYDWREFNPGLALAPYYQFHQAGEIFLSVGSYKNSVNNTSKLALLGFRGYFIQDPINFGVTGGYGMVTGYYASPTMAVVGGFIGSDRVSLECAYSPRDNGGKDYPGTAAIAIWLRVRLLKL